MTVALARRFKVDVSNDGTSWIPLKGINDLNPSIKATNQSADDYDSDGWSAFEKTMQTWSVTAKALRLTASGVFDPGQELVRAAQTGWGDAARVYVRWYDKNNAPEAYSGRALVEWVPSKTGVTDLDEVTITLNGDGILTPITNPVTNSNDPVITAVTSTPAAQSQGGLVRIQGAYFTGTVATTGVKFGGVNATSWDLVSDSLIEAIMPAGTAGSAAVVVTNAAGASNSFPYTRGA